MKKLERLKAELAQKEYELSVLNLRGNLTREEFDSQWDLRSDILDLKKKIKLIEEIKK